MKTSSVKLLAVPGITLFYLFLLLASGRLAHSNIHFFLCCTPTASKNAMLCQPKCGSRAYLEQEGLKTSQWFHWKSLRPRIKKRNVLWVKTWHTNNLKTVISLVVLWWLGIAKKPSLSFHAFFCASSFSMQTFPLLMGLSKGLLFSLLPSPTMEMLQRHRAAAAAAETPCGISTSHRFGK